ncbi:MAG TPA: hypothetical protein VFI96_01735 [Longimicrobiaceae bacterium]|nr:hypothetical protein [Longimicrobiaceae bacterium]
MAAKKPARRKRGGNPAHRATKERRAQVAALAGFGVRQDEIALYLEIDAKTLRKHYRRELDVGTIQANTAIARRLFSAAKDEGSVPAMIFWLKARAGWSEKQQMDVTSGGDPLALTVRFVRPEADADHND